MKAEEVMATRRQVMLTYASRIYAAGQSISTSGLSTKCDMRVATYEIRHMRFVSV